MSTTLAWKTPMDGGAWWAAVHGVTKSQTRLSDFTFTFHFHALEKEMATHSSVLAWRIPGTGEPGGLPSMGSHRVGQDWSNLAAAAAMVYTFLSSMKWWHAACTKTGEPSGLPRSLSFNRSSPTYHFFQIPPPARIKASALACYRAQISLHYPNQKPGSTFPWLFSPFLYLISLQVLYIWAPKSILNPSPLFILSVSHLLNPGLQHILLIAEIAPDQISLFQMGLAPLFKGASAYSQK